MAEEEANNVQMGRIEATKLVRRAGGKKARTQLNKGGSEIVVQMMNLKKCHAKKREKVNNVDAQLRVAFYQALYEVDAEKQGANGQSKADQQNQKEQKDKTKATRSVKTMKTVKSTKIDRNEDEKVKPPNTVKLEVLRDTARIFADTKYKPQLLRAEVGKLDETREAEFLNLKEYRKKLELLQLDYRKKGKTKHQEAVITLIQAVDKRKTLTPKEISTVYDTLGDDGRVSKHQVKPLMEDMKKQGILADEDAKEFEWKVAHKETIRCDEVTTYMSTKVELRPDYTIGSKMLDEDHPGYETYRPKFMEPTVFVSVDPKFSKTVAEGLKTTTKLRDHTTITVNLDDWTDRPKTMVNFKTVDAKIAGINASGAPKWL